MEAYALVTECLDGRSSMDDTVSEIRLVHVDEQVCVDKGHELNEEMELRYEPDNLLWWDYYEGFTLMYVDKIKIEGI